jgi:hypothetical protein
MAKMEESDLLGVLQKAFSDSDSIDASELAVDRDVAMQRYLRLQSSAPVANPFGSDVVASTVFDTVQGMLPDILAPFLEAENPVEFTPTGPEDDESKITCAPP